MTETRAHRCAGLMAPAMPCSGGLTDESTHSDRLPGPGVPGPFVASGCGAGCGRCGRTLRHRCHDPALWHAHRRPVGHAVARRGDPYRGRLHRCRWRLHAGGGRHGDRPHAGHLPARPHRRARPRAHQDGRLPGRPPASLVGLQGVARSQRGAADAAVRVDDGAHPRRRGRVLRPPRRAHRDTGRHVRRTAHHGRRALLLDHGRRWRPQLHRPGARGRGRWPRRRRRRCRAQGRARGDQARQRLDQGAGERRDDVGRQRPRQGPLQPRRIERDRRRGHPPRRARGGTCAFGGGHPCVDPRGRAHDRARHLHRR